MTEASQDDKRASLKRLRVWRRRRGLCTVCGGPGVEGRPKCAKCKAAADAGRHRRHANGPEWTCETCGEAFHRDPQVGRTPRFCSKSCANRGERNPAWRGGTSENRGYVMIKDDDSYSYQLEHRKVMAGLIGRPLHPEETVHHKNGNKADNRPENLELWLGRHPKGQRHHEGRHCSTCTCETVT